nr:hypothetical protein [uncultured Campylobacter sp.]
MIPYKTLFDRGVRCAGGIYTARANELLDAIAQAGLGYRFRQIYWKILNEPREQAL